MPFSSAGVFNPQITFKDGTDATAEDQNVQDQDIAAGLSACMTRSGLAPATANIPMGGNRITGLASGVNPTDAATLAQVSSVVLPGVIVMYGGSSPPAGYLVCTGGAISRTIYSALFAAIGVGWGPGDGSTTFNLPDLRGRAPIGAGAFSGGTNRVLAATGGEETDTLTISTMPQHAHTDSGHTHTVTDPGHVHPVGISGANGYLYDVPSGGTAYGTGPGQKATSSNTGSATTGLTVSTGIANIQSTGNGLPHNNMQPFAAVNFIIKT